MTVKGKSRLFMNPSILDKKYILISSVYFVFVVLSHDWISHLYTKVFNHLGRNAMEGLLGFAALGASVILVLSFHFFRKAEWRLSVSAIVLFAVTLGLMILADMFLVSTRVEWIHYPQYAILGLLLLSAIPDTFFVLFLGTLAGAVDETIQYMWHPQYTKYLDFNDFVLNFLGVLLGIAVWRVLYSRRDSAVSRKVQKSKVALYAITAVLLGLFAAGSWSGRVVSVLPEEQDFQVITRIEKKTVFVLSFVRQPAFWSKTDFGRTYHVLSPGEGIVALGLLLAGFRLFDGRRQTVRSGAGLSPREFCGACRKEDTGDGET